MTSPTASSVCSILIVDDHFLVRSGIANLLESRPQFDLVGQAETAAKAPDLILLDIMLPDERGFAVCRKIKASHPGTRVVFLTSYRSDDLVHEALDAGCDGFLLKDVKPQAFIDAILEVHRGGSVLSPGAASSVLRKVRQPADSGNSGPDPAILSLQERRVLRLVAEGLTNKEIAAKMGLSDKTVKNYLSNAMDKLGIRRRAQAAVYYVEHFPEPPAESV
jgi:DNA-binding NarL/FixJ family response regulator